MEIAIVVMRQGDNFLLQLRGDSPHVGAPGLIGFFGGKVEPHDTSVTMAGCREIGEETNLTLLPDAVIEIGQLTVDMEYNGKPIRIQTHVLYTDLAVGRGVDALEGELVRMTLPEMHARQHELTPATKKALLELL